MPIQSHIFCFVLRPLSSNRRGLGTLHPFRWNDKNNFTPIDLIPKFCKRICGSSYLKTDNGQKSTASTPQRPTHRHPHTLKERPHPTRGIISKGGARLQRTNQIPCHVSPRVISLRSSLRCRALCAESFLVFGLGILIGVRKRIFDTRIGFSSIGRWQAPGKTWTLA